jgi:hypothetical protein
MLSEPFYKMVNENKSNPFLIECFFHLTFSSILDNNFLLLINNNQLKFYHRQLDIMNLNKNKKNILLGLGL